MPTLALSGAAIGFLLMGVIYMTLGALIEAPQGHIWDTKQLTLGVISIGISIVIIAGVFIYWNLVVKKKGIIMPPLIGVGLIFAILGFISAVMLAVELIRWSSRI